MDWNDRATVIAAVQRRGSALEHVPECFKSDKDVVLAAVRSYSFALFYVHKSLRTDYDVALAAVQKNSAILSYIHESLLLNPKFIRAVCKLPDFNYYTKYVVNWNIASPIIDDLLKLLSIKLKYSYN